MVTGTVVSSAKWIEQLWADSQGEQVRIVTNNPAFLTAFTALSSPANAPSDNPSLECVATTEAVHQAVSDDIAAIKLADLLETNRLALRSLTLPESGFSTYVVTSNSTMLLAPLENGEFIQLEADDETAHPRLVDDFETKWNAAIPYTAEMPPYTRLMELTEQSVGADIRTEFEAMIDDIGDVPPEQQPSLVVAAILLGGKHELLLRDVVKWMETTTLATQGTVSKFKQNLEDEGLIETESENIGVGRPRQRLHLATEDPREEHPADLITELC